MKSAVAKKILMIVAHPIAGQFPALRNKRKFSLEINDRHR